MPELQLSKEQIVAEKRRRAAEKVDKLQSEFSMYAEDGFWKYLQYMRPKFFTDEKHILKDMATIFQRVSLGELKRVLISIYPRAGKSYMCSLWIAWDLGYNVENSYMRNCYGEVLASELSKSVMDIIESEEYQSIFPNISLDPKSSSKLAWAVKGSQQLTYFGTGISGAITGRGCNRASILDDPIKNPEDGMNQVYLDKIETFYTSVIESRLDANSEPAEIIISTRWNEGDPIGLRENDPEWTVFSFPALDENGKSTCEAMNPTKNLMKIKKSFERAGNGWMFQTQYMCKPINNLIAKFKKDDLRYYRAKDFPTGFPDDIVAYIDYANKGKDNLSCIFGYMFGSDIYVPDVIFSADNSSELKPLIIEKILQHKPLRVIFESNQGGEEYADSIRELIEPVSDSSVDTIYSSSNKQVRILVRSGSIKKNMIFLDKEDRNDHYFRFMNNLHAYAGHKNQRDDAPDSCAGLIGEVFTDSQASVSSLDLLTGKMETSDTDENYVDNKTKHDLIDSDGSVFSF